jgi:uncharacterized protein (TIGR01777 family)
MRILLTGATGLVGVPAAQALFAAGHELVVLARSPQKVEGLFGVPAESHAWSASEKLNLSNYGKIDAIVHLAGDPIGEGSWSAEKKARVLSSREDGSRLIAEAIEALPQADRPKTWVSASAIGIYGSRADEELTEESKPWVTGTDCLPGALGRGVEYLADVCARWEKQTLRPIAGVRSVALRFGMILSPNGGALQALLPVFAAGVGGPVGDGKQWMSWVHLDDAVAAIVHAVDGGAGASGPLSGPVNVVAPAPVRNSEFSKTLAKTLGRPAILPAPGFALKTALGEKSALVLPSQRILPVKLQRSGFEFRFGDLGAALQDLCEYQRIRTCQWVPKPLPEVFQFFSDEHNLERITPPFLNFKVLGKTTAQIEKDTEIEYKLKLHGLPMSWRSRIDIWEPNQRFRDIQLKGPYKVWKHLHTFQEVRGGTLIRDDIRYALPMGFLGQTFAGAWVARDVGQIFTYRQKIIEEIFGRKS